MVNVYYCDGFYESYETEKLALKHVSDYAFSGVQSVEVVDGPCAKFQNITSRFMLKLEKMQNA